MNNERGVTLIESLLVIVLVAVIVFLMANLANAMNLINKSKHLSLAREIAAKQIEDERAIKYINLVNAASDINDSRISLLPGGGGTVTVDDCSGQICPNAEHLKVVTVTVSWKDNNRSQNITLNTFIAEGGLN